MKRLSNTNISSDYVHSTHLMNLADVVIDLATSVVFEAVRAKIPVLAADYLHADRSIIAVYMTETELRCRDDVYEKIDGFLSNGCDSFYTEVHHQRFLNEMLDVDDTDVLSRYVDLLEKSASR